MWWGNVGTKLNSSTSFWQLSFHLVFIIVTQLLSPFFWLCVIHKNNTSSDTHTLLCSFEITSGNILFCSSGLFFSSSVFFFECFLYTCCLLYLYHTFPTKQLFCHDVKLQHQPQATIEKYYLEPHSAFSHKQNSANFEKENRVLVLEKKGTKGHLIDAGKLELVRAAHPNEPGSSIPARLWDTWLAHCARPGALLSL